MPIKRTCRIALLAALAMLSITSPGMGQTKAAAVRNAPLKQGGALKPFDLPPEATARLFVDAGPVAPGTNARSLLNYVSGRVRRESKGGIEVDSEGHGEHWTPVALSEPRVFEWFHGGRFFNLCFFFRGREWWVSSAETLEAKLGDALLTLLDADANGECWDANDYVRWRDGTFRAHGEVNDVDDGQLAGSLRLVGKNHQVSLRFVESTRATELDDQQWLAFRTANALRNQHGFAPAAIWPEACKQLTAHTQFLLRHDPKRTGTLATYYGEAVGLEGRTPEADEMSRTGCVGYLEGDQDVAFQVRTVLTMTQSRSEVFAPGAAKFGHGRTANWSFFRASPGAEPWGSRYSVLPGAGAKDVPRTCGKNWPFPRSFPALYDNPRGLPISVRLASSAIGDGFQPKVRSIALFASPGEREVAGFFFSIRDIGPGAPEDCYFFVPGEPLTADSDYLAQATIEGTRSAGGGAGMTTDADLLQWQFHTGR